MLRAGALRKLLRAEKCLRMSAKIICTIFFCASCSKQVACASVAQFTLLCTSYSAQVPLHKGLCVTTQVALRKSARRSLRALRTSFFAQVPIFCRNALRLLVLRRTVAMFPRAQRGFNPAAAQVQERSRNSKDQLASRKSSTKLARDPARAVREARSPQGRGTHKSQKSSIVWCDQGSHKGKALRSFWKSTTIRAKGWKANAKWDPPHTFRNQQTRS